MSKKTAASKEDLLDLFAQLRNPFDDHDLVYKGAASDPTLVEVPTPLLDLERRARAEDASISKAEMTDALPALRDLLQGRLSAHEAARMNFYASKAAAFKAMEQQQAPCSSSSLKKRQRADLPRKRPQPFNRLRLPRRSVLRAPRLRCPSTAEPRQPTSASPSILHRSKSQSMSSMPSRPPSILLTCKCPPRA